MTQVQSVGQEDPLVKEMAAHSSILAWEIPWTEEPSRATVHGVAKESDTTWQLNNRVEYKYTLKLKVLNCKTNKISGWIRLCCEGLSCAL